MAQLTCNGKSTREINREIRAFIAAGKSEVRVLDPGARHNLGVALLKPVHLTLEGSAGYYCAGMIDGATVEVKGSAGWGLAESMMSGKVIVHGNAGNGTAASIRGGTVVVRGHASARLGVAMKGGLIVVGGDCGYMAGFMGQRGRIIVCGDTGEGFADSMYETECFVGGEIAELGNDAVVETPAENEFAFLSDAIQEHLDARPDVTRFKKVVAGRKLWNFDKDERAVWREAL
ncbi:MAG: glutamate synthase [Gemmatimonadota bacterium]|nr:glutamate synthase [Gemmatimonadota bacterium]